MPKNIVIAGAGLVGSMLALALKQKGHAVTLFEKRSDMRKGDIDVGKSINLIITAKGIHALRSAGIFSDVEKITSPVLGRMMHSLEGELTFQPYGRDESEYNLSVSRGELNAMLMDKAEAAGVKIHFDEELESINFENKTASFTSVKDIQYDTLFGTDGAGSHTRRELKKLLGNDMQESMTSLGVKYKELFMPAAGENKYPIDEKSLHIWPRGEHMLMALPNQGGSFTMTVYLPDNKLDGVKTNEDVQAYFSEFYGDALEHMPEYLKQFNANPWGFLGTARCNPWVYQDSVCLVGDAAHAMVPFFGQGMNTGFSDVQFLINAFDRHQDNWNLALSEYNEFQKQNGDAMQDMSVENYRIMSERVADEKFLLQKKVEHLLENTYPNKFRSKYGMVTYTLIPYHHAKAAGKIQAEILQELCSGITSADEVDLKKGLELIEAKLLPFMHQHKLDIARYQ